jgi:hypothetical protein
MTGTIIQFFETTLFVRSVLIQPSRPLPNSVPGQSLIFHRR